MDTIKYVNRKKLFLDEIEEEAGRELFSKFNKAYIVGVIEEEFKYSYGTYIKYYETRVKVKRSNGLIDYIPIIISEWMLNPYRKQNFKGKEIEVAGRFCSYKDHHPDGSSHVLLYVFASSILIYPYNGKENDNNNVIFLEGHLVRKPYCQVRPSGTYSADFILSVSGRLTKTDYLKTDYIPCVAFDNSANLIETVHVGGRVRLYGRIQSRSYYKYEPKGSNNKVYGEAYEVIVHTMQEVI